MNYMESGKPASPDAASDSARRVVSGSAGVPAPATGAAAPPPATRQVSSTGHPASAVDEPDQDDRDPHDHGGFDGGPWVRMLPSWLISASAHALFLLVLALISLPQRSQAPPQSLTLNTSNLDQKDVDISAAAANTEFSAPQDSSAADVTEPRATAEFTAALNVGSLDTSPPTAEPVPSLDDLDPLPADVASASSLLVGAGGIPGTELSGRGGQDRAELVRQGGGTGASEQAVADALTWLVAHQFPDGSWSLDFRGGPCQGRCTHPGSLDLAVNGATGLALLPLLGAGQTHKKGQHKEAVQKGLDYLIGQMQMDKKRGSLVDSQGTYYSHGICAIALCEAYAMTKDPKLRGPAQMAINQIVFAQHSGGGWRYGDQMPGDTSVVGWQLMALKSAYMGYLEVPRSTILRATQFLDSVESNYGAQYGYTSSDAPGRGTTAVGLLCRMYLGWKRDHPGLVRGVELLDSWGPSKSDMYYNYYATQVMRHYGGPEWERWNRQMRDFLIHTQAKLGHETGSWYVAGGNPDNPDAHERDRSSRLGGRHYETAMACMILEVYYRYLPIYTEQAAEDDFPL